MNRLLILILLISCNTIFGQVIEGTLFNAKSKQPIEFANIGIVGKNIGTVSDINGKFNLLVDSSFDNDVVLFSMIGYNPLYIKTSDLRKDKVLYLEEKVYEMDEVVVKPNIFKQRTLGVTTKNKGISVGFNNYFLGYECGILMKVKKTAFIKRVIINISECSYDTVFFRLNIYKVLGKMDFENIITEPIYIKMSKESVKDQIQVDLQAKNIVVEGDFLVTLENVKKLGSGHFNFCASLTNKTYFRETSHGEWKTGPAGISISVIADVEK